MFYSKFCDRFPKKLEQSRVMYCERLLDVMKSLLHHLFD